jgi:hypothetical protein
MGILKAKVLTLYLRRNEVMQYITGIEGSFVLMRLNEALTDISMENDLGLSRQYCPK